MVTFLTKEKAESLIGTKIKNLDLYQKAFTHKSALKEYEQFTESFETLEFIGDSVLGFCSCNCRSISCSTSHISTTPKSRIYTNI